MALPGARGAEEEGIFALLDEARRGEIVDEGAVAGEWCVFRSIVNTHSDST